MALTTVSIEFSDGETRVWNVTDDQAEEVNDDLNALLGAPNLISGEAADLIREAHNT